MKRFLFPLREDARGCKNVEEIFGNIEQVLQVNKELLKNLEDCTSNCSNAEIKIGDVFLQVVS